ncbi:MAG: hypothetical protein U5J98_08315 [Halobacteriales archaeon]|nr:hypothetical protein [Halobacteriales archaeon]
MSVAALAGRLRPAPRTAQVGAVVLAVELAAVGLYLGSASVEITDPLILVYPLVWINVGLWAVWRTDVPAASGRRRLVVGVLALGYLGVLAAVGGVIDLSHAAHGHVHAAQFRVAYASLPPGFGPAVFYSGSVVSLNLLPYQVVGYAALAYLVYATVLDAAGSAVSGLLGLFSCVSCTWPVIGTVVAGLFGSGSAVYTFALTQSYALSTVVFVSAVALLRWRPEL